MYTNAPNRLERVNAFNSFNIQYVDYVRNCEDAVLDADAGFALLSCDPGRDSWNTVMVRSRCRRMQGIDSDMLRVRLMFPNPLLILESICGTIQLLHQNQTS